jgi:hypothetical protein
MFFIFLPPHILKPILTNRTVKHIWFSYRTKPTLKKPKELALSHSQ